MLIAFVMLFGPEHFHSLSQAQMQYANLSTATWAQGDTTIEYTYDANGSVETKITTVTSTTDVIETVTNEYNLQNRLAKVTTENEAGDKHIVEYTYNDEGIRVESYSYDIPYGGGIQGEKKATCLTDPYNHTGYAQTLERVTISYMDPEPVTVTTTYLIGDDVLAQTDNSENTRYLLCDGHGSTRQLAEYDTDVTIADSYSYDAYGVMLQDDSVASADPGKAPAQATSLLYTGEHFDSDAQQYYLRARWYNPLNGRFNRTDPFSGNYSDPQSLHKYLYCHANPISGTDPTGLMFLAGVFTVQKITAVAIGALVPAIITAYESAKAGLGWGEILWNAAIAYALAFGLGMLMVAVGPYVLKAITSLLTKIPGITAGMVKAALSVLFIGLGLYGLVELWTSDYPFTVKLSVTVVVVLAFIVAVYKPAKTGGRLGGSSTRAQNKRIASELKSRRYEITHGGGEAPEEYLRGPGPGSKGGNYVDITAKHKDTGHIIRINTVDTRVDGITPTGREINAAAAIRAKLPPGEHLLLVPKVGG